jgi:hypothetical protein
MMDELISRLTPILPHPQQQMQSSSSNIITKGKLLIRETETVHILRAP